MTAASFLELALPSYDDAASDAASSLCSEAPPSTPVDWCAGLGAACRGCAAAFRHTRSAYTELRQDQLDALNRRRQAEMLVFEDTSSGTLSLVPSVASVSAVPSSASAGSSACASPLQRRNSAELLGAPLPPGSSAS